MRVRNAAAAILSVVVLAACGGGGSATGTSPTGASDTTRPPAGLIPVFLQIQQGGNEALASFSFTLDGHTVTAFGDYRFNLPAGVHEVTGRLNPGSMQGGINVRIHGLEGQDVARFGGPQKGTLQPLEGPTVTTFECGLLYQIPFNSPLQLYTVRFQFFASKSVSPAQRC